MSAPVTAPATRIAMWSGPRNLSTAMMRSFGARADCAVSDEPFYAAFLAVSGVDHPMREDVLAAHEVDPARTAAHCVGPVPGGRSVHYQKHMTHHMLPSFDLTWADSVTNAFLIRNPAEVAASYEVKRERPTADDLGVAAQARLFDRMAERLGRAPPLVNAADVRTKPEATLRKLCAALHIPWDPAMLTWSPGRRDTDGVWAQHWYGSVEASTGFSPPQSRAVTLSDHAKKLVDEALPIYSRLAQYAL